MSSTLQRAAAALAVSAAVAADDPVAFASRDVVVAPGGFGVAD
ncbi:hypothetical protein [Streptomyces sp. NRRL S-87]|nr:hypothetical protein [Streptomyces sp. NRRL S-87]